MKTFKGQDGGEWVATVHEEDTPRHHGRWYLVLHPAGDTENTLLLPDIRWQDRATAERTIGTMSEFELQRRLRLARGRGSQGVAPSRDAFGGWEEQEPRA